MPQTLAQRIRATYPGAYDDLSDQQLEAKVDAKYPGAYADLPHTPPDDVSALPPMALTASHASAPETRSVFRRVADAVAGANGPVDYAGGDARALADTSRDLARGAGAGAASTMFHGGDLIRRGLGLNRVINRPEVQAGITPPASLAGRLGYGGEQLAEFALPLATVSQATTGASLLARMAAEGATSAGVAGAQSGGDPGTVASTALIGGALPAAGALVRGAAGVAQRAAAGAAEGGVGGALAGAVRTAAPSEPARLLVQALKPRTTQAGFEASLARALPELKATEAATGQAITNVDELLSATKIAKQRVRAQYDAVAGPQRAMGSTVDLTPVADAMEASIPKKVRLEDPAKAAAIAEQADIYRGRFDLTEAEQLLKETNAELDAFYAKHPAAQRAAVTADPEVAHLVAQAKAMRTAIYATLDAPGQGEAARELQRRYGALLELEDTAGRRQNVVNRQQPESLSQQIGKVRAAGEYAKGAFRLMHGDLSGAADIAGARAGRAMADTLKEHQTTNTLIKRALAAFHDQPVPVVMPPQPRIAGLLGRGPLVTPAPADASFVRGVPAESARRDIRALLTAGRPEPLVTPPPADTSGGVSARANSNVQRDPRTGRMRRVYTGEAK